MARTYFHSVGDAQHGHDASLCSAGRLLRARTTILVIVARRVVSPKHPPGSVGCCRDGGALFSSIIMQRHTQSIDQFAVFETHHGRRLWLLIRSSGSGIFHVRDGLVAHGTARQTPRDKAIEGHAVSAAVAALLAVPQDGRLQRICLLLFYNDLPRVVAGGFLHCGIECIIMILWLLALYTSSVVVRINRSGDWVFLQHHAVKIAKIQFSAENGVRKQ